MPHTVKMTDYTALIKNKLSVSAQSILPAVPWKQRLMINITNCPCCLFTHNKVNSCMGKIFVHMQRATSSQPSSCPSPSLHVQQTSNTFVRFFHVKSTQLHLWILHIFFFSETSNCRELAWLLRLLPLQAWTHLKRWPQAQKSQVTLSLKQGSSSGDIPSSFGSTEYPLGGENRHLKVGFAPMKPLVVEPFAEFCM